MKKPGHKHQLATASQARAFVLAGKAVVTLVSKKTGTRFTYRVRKSDDGKVHFIHVLTGPDNTNSYRYLGFYKGNRYEHGVKSKIAANATSAKASDWFFNTAIASDGKLPDNLEVWHQGYCGKCGKALTVPESIRRGLGPHCAGLV